VSGFEEHRPGGRLLFVSKGENSASTRYRALQFFPRWQAAGYTPSHVTASGGAGALLEMLKQARRADVVVVLRKTFPPPILWLLRWAARRLVFDFDDAIFCNTDGSPSATRMARFAAMIRYCDHVCAGNAFLAQQASRFNTAVTVVPTSIDPEKYAITATKPTDTIDLVWIGSSSTKKYLVDAMPWLAAATKSIPRLRLKIIADFDLPDSGIPTLAIPWQAETEAQELASAHIGIAPMRDNDWTRGKCALKVLQYMSAGLPVVSSLAGANADIIEEGQTGYLVAEDADWVARLDMLARDANLRAQMGEAGRRKVMAEYAIDPVFEKIRRAFEALV
jgi:glycosyltransferase involved in cell wall biosynthesis